ncbi:MAG TPA: hypothetical protein VJ140_09170 [Actinomycetota bacterium]|jgi:hypothetical protein|nr:hypothetical protein [Actinomycetota bacterium]
MSSRSLGVVSLERFLAVERYRETHQAPSTHPYRTAESGGRVGRVTREPWRSNGTSGKAR